MKLDELLRQETIENLRNRGVPESFIEEIKEEYEGYSGKRLFTLFQNIEVYEYTSMLQWYNELPNHWQLANGHDELGNKTSNVYDMSTLYPACALSGDIYLYIPG